MAAVVDNRSLPVILKKFQSHLDLSVLQTAVVSKRCQILATLGADDRLILWSIRSDARWSLPCVKQFRWSLHDDSLNDESCVLLGFSFAVVKSDGILELYSLSQSTENICCICETFVTKDHLRELLQDEGKDWPFNKIDLLSVCRNLDSICEVSLLLDRRFVIVVSGGNETPVSICMSFALDDAASSRGKAFSSVIQIRKCNTFFFTLLSNGIVLIHNTCDLVASVDLCLVHNCDIKDNLTKEAQPIFCHMEVTQDLSLLVCADAASNVYVINLNEFLQECSSDALSSCGSSFKMAQSGFVRFQYELGDEDSVARGVQMSSVTYGDRVWKAELLACKRDVKEHSSLAFSGRMFTTMFGANDGNDSTTPSASRRQPSRLREVLTGTTPDSPSQFSQGITFLPCQSWMAMFSLEGLSVTPSSFLLWLKATQLTVKQWDGSVLPYGFLCLFSFSSQQFVYHWLSEPSLLVESCGTIHPVLLLNSKSLAVPGFDISQDQLVHKVIIYDSARLADSLCRVNQWNHCAIPLHALDVALRLRQLDTVAFFLKNQEKVFTSQVVSSSHSSSPSLLSSSPILVVPSSHVQIRINTKEVRDVTEALLKALDYNMRQQHSKHFTDQLAQMTLNYLHNVVKDGTRLLEDKCFHDKCCSIDCVEGASLHCYPEVKECLRFLSRSIVGLRCHLGNIPLDEGDGPRNVGLAFTDMQVDEEEDITRNWISLADEEVAERAIINRHICSAQTFFQNQRQAQKNDMRCDGSFGSLLRLGLEVVLHKLVNEDVDSAFIMSTNMGRSFLQQVHKICLYTLDRTLRDLLVRELKARNGLSPQDGDIIDFVHSMEVMFSQPSFAVSERKLKETTSKWNDLGLLRNSFHLGSNHILETYVQSGNLRSTVTYQQISPETHHYVEVPLVWAHSWDVLSKQRILVERVLVERELLTVPSDSKLDAQALWLYLTSHCDWQTLLPWIRSVISQHQPTVYVCEAFAVHGNVILPSLTREVFGPYHSCPQVLKDMIVEELTESGKLGSSEFVDSYLLNYMGITQKIFGDNLSTSTLDGHVNDGDSEEPLWEKPLMSLASFHCNVTDYCIRRKLVNLLYHYLDFYRLGETKNSVSKLNLDLDPPSWLDMLVKFRFLGLNPTVVDAVFESSLSNYGLVMINQSPSITDMLNSRHPVMALSSLMYGPNLLTQAIIRPGVMCEICPWQVEESLLLASLISFPKVHSAIFPVSSGVNSVEPQDVSVYQLLQGNCPFEISRLFGWQSTNELTQNRETPHEIPYFSQFPLVTHHAHFEKLTFSYYLRHGRPAFAFASFVGDQLRDKAVSKARIQHAAFKAYKVAVQHLHHQKICSACVVFTEMLGLASTTLRIDIQASNRILAHVGREIFGSDSREGKTMQDLIALELLSCARKTSRRPERVLKALEVATRNLVSKECLDRTSFEAGQEWHLVVLFCRAHNMELSSTFLQECARANKWLPFVCHAQVCQFPKAQTVDIIEHEVSNSSIKEHLKLAFDNVLSIKVETPVAEESARRQYPRKRSRQKGEQVLTKERDVRAQFYARMGLMPEIINQSSLDISAEEVTLLSCSSSTEDDEILNMRTNHGSDNNYEITRGLKTIYKPVKPLCSEDLPRNVFDIIFKCQSAENPWQNLLAHAIALHNSFLAVLATCYENAKPLDCFCAWLSSSLSPSVLEPAVAIILGFSQAGSADIQNLQWRKWTLDDLSTLIWVIVASQEKIAHTLLEAFYIFDPNNPLVNFFHFYESYVVHSDYEACQESLNAFKKSHSKMIMKTARDNKEDLPSIGNVEWLERLSIQVIKQMLSKCESSPQQHHLLAVLALPMFGRNFSCQVPNFHSLHEISTILRGTSTEIRAELLLQESSGVTQAEKERVLQSLLNTKHFAEARLFAALVDIHDDRITLKEVEADLQSAKNSMLWEIEQGRLAFWHKAEKCFRSNGCKAGTIGSFFECQAEDDNLSFTERAKLLSMAVKWFSISGTDGQSKSADELRGLQKKTWLFKIRSELERDCEAKLIRSVSHLEILPPESDIDLSGETLPSMDRMFHKIAHAKDLVQEDVGDIQSDSESVLETDKEVRALEHVIGQLLDEYHVTQARWLAGLFNHSSLELDAILSCIYLAQGSRSADKLPERIQTLLSAKGQMCQSVSGSITKGGHNSSFVFNSSFTETTTGSHLDSLPYADWIRVADIITLMETLAFHCHWGKRCCSCIIICYKVAQTLVHDYKTIVNEKPFKVLHSLLVSGFDNRFSLIDSYIKAMQLDTVEVTRFLADTILRSLHVYSTGEELSEGEFDDLIVNAAPSCDDISRMICLCPDYSLLGNNLLDTANSLASERATSASPSEGLTLEVELLVRAHECHTLACNMEGIASVLRSARVLTAALADAREYGLLVRLLTGVGRFHEMSYIFDTLFDHEHFELLCRKGIDKENKLKVALLDYLRRQHPEDTDKFSMVAHHFSMYREIAQTLEETAMKQLKRLGDCFQERTDIPSSGEKGLNNEVLSKLTSIMKSFCYASDNYAKENCWRHSQSCLRNARLVHLQIQLLVLEIRVVNLDEFALKKFLATHNNFFQALVVAEAYKKRDVSMWVEAVYSQVVVKGDLKYLQDMRSAMPLSSALFVDVVNKYKSENMRSSQAAANMTRLLGFVHDVRIRYKLATELNFRDIASSLLEEDGGAFLRDAMLP